ncbi:MAG: MFS transporter, partial [Planctomycetales bacterium]|nr:MFS transporter [Planctomycetales bacterium]
MWDQPTSQRAIVIAGCLGMAYTQLTMSPATIEFARANGADGLHIGILGALPTATIFMQFVAAVLVNHLQYRRTVWFTVSIIQRLVYLPIALGPWLVKEV